MTKLHCIKKFDGNVIVNISENLVTISDIWWEVKLNVELGKKLGWMWSNVVCLSVYLLFYLSSYSYSFFKTWI